MDTFPYASWEDATQAALDSGGGYFTFGPGGNTATIVMVVLGFLVMMATIVGGIILEDRRLDAHAARLKAGGDNGVR